MRRPIHRRAALAALAALAGGACGRSRRPAPRDLGPPPGPTLAPGQDAPLTVVASVEPAPYPQSPPKELLANDELALHDWSLAGDAKLARRAVVLVPRHLSVAERVPLLIALHGLGETVDEEMGAYAWVRRYGIAEGYAHLRRPDTIDSLGAMISGERADELRATLAAQPFRGMVVACPYTPNFWKVGPSPEATLDAYARWLFEVLVPRLRAETPALVEPEHLGVDGVSLGGYASLAVGARRAAELGAIGCVQAALSVAEAPGWADRISTTFATTGSRPLHLLTSTLDVFRPSVEALDRALVARKVPHDFRLAIGPHDQPFLRGPGSLEMLLWQSRALGG